MTVALLTVNILKHLNRANILKKVIRQGITLLAWNPLQLTDNLQKSF